MNNLLSMTGKVALVTGSSSGLGAHFSKALAKAGAKVVLSARRLDRLEELAKDIRADGATALAVYTDITKAGSIATTLEEAETEFGPITVLVNNAGVDSSKTLFELKQEDLDHVIDTNLMGSWIESSLVS